MQVEKLPRILKIAEVVSATAMSQATIYRRAKTDARFKPVKLGEHASGWLESDIADWLRECIAAKTADSDKATRKAKTIRSFRVEVAA